MNNVLCRLGGLALSTALLFVVASCVDSDYDLNKDISKEIQFGGSEFGVRIGTTDSIKVSQLLKADDLIKIENDEYYLKKDSDVSISVDPISAVNINRISPTIDPIVVEFDEVPSIPGVVVEVHEFTSDQAIFSSDIDVNTDEPLPSTIKRIDLVTLKAGRTQANLHISLSGFPAGVTTLELKRYKIHFPKNFIFDSAEGFDANNDLYITTSVPVNAGVAQYSLTLDLIGFKDLPLNASHYIELPANDKAVKMSGPLVARGNIDIAKLDNIEIRPTFVINPMSISEVKGIVDPDIVIQNSQIELGDIPDFLKGEGVVLDVKNPQIIITTSNSLEMPIEATLVLVPRDENQNSLLPNGEKITATITIPRAMDENRPTVSVFRITNKDEISDGTFIPVKIANLSDLIKRIPDIIDIDIIPKVVGDNHIVTLEKKYNLKIDYDVSVPFDFGNKLNIDYTEVVDGLKEDLKDVTNKISQLELKLNVTNKIPLALSLGILPVDEAGNPLSDVMITNPAYPEIPAIDRPFDIAYDKENTFTINLTEKVSGALRELDGLKIIINANAHNTIDGMSLKPKQFLKVEIRAKIPGGIHVDLDDL